MEERKSIVTLKIVTAILAAAMVCSCIILSIESRSSTERRIFTSLSDSATQQITSMQTAIEGRFTTLEAYSGSISVSREFNFSSDKIYELMQNVRDADVFSEIIIANIYGIGYNADAERVDVSGLKGYQVALLGEKCIERADLLGEGQDQLIMTVPLYKADRISGMIVGVFEVSDFEKLVEMRADKLPGYSMLCDEYGSIIAKSQNIPSSSNTMFDIFPDEAFPKNDFLDTLKTWKSGQTTFFYEGKLYYNVYCPLGINGWMLINFIPGDAVGELTDETINTAYMITIMIIILSICMIFCVYYIDRRSRMNVELERQDLCAAVDRSGRMTLRYDFYTDTAYILGGKSWFFEQSGTVENFTRQLLSQGIVLQDSVYSLMSIKDNMRAFVPEGECDLHVKHQDGSLHWEHAEFILVGKPGALTSHAIVTFYDNTEQREKELAYDKWKNDLSAMIASSACYLEVNLTEDTVERVEGFQRVRKAAEKCNNVFSGLVVKAAKVATEETVTGEFVNFFDTQRLTSLYEGGIYSDMFDYLSKERGRWYRCKVQMARYPGTDAVKAFVILTDIDDEMRDKEALTKLAYCDMLTGLYNRSTLEKKVRGALSEAKPEQLSAMLLLDIDNFKGLNDTKGHQAGDIALRNLAGVLKSGFGNGEIVGRLGGDEFVIFAPSCEDDDTPKKLAEGVVEAAQMVVDNVLITISVGVSSCRGGSKSFEQLYKESDDALYKAKTAGRSRACVFEGDGAAQKIEEAAGDVFSIQLQTLLENMDGGILTGDVGDEITINYVSPSFYKTVNGSLDGSMPIADMMKLIYSEDYPGVVKAIRSAAESGVTTDCVYRVKRSEECWQRLRVVKLCDNPDGSVAVIGVLSDITSLKRSEEQLRSAEERYRIAISRTSSSIWEVELSTHRFITGIEDPNSLNESRRVIDNAPDSILNLGYVSAKTAGDFKKTFADIYACREGGEYAFAVRGKHNRYEWLKSGFGILRDGSGRAIRAIGVSEHIPNVEANMRMFDEEKRFMEMIQGTLLGSIHLNLTKNTIKSISLPTNTSGISSATELFERSTEMMELGSDFDEISAQMKTEWLLQTFENGRSWLNWEFRRKRTSCEPSWTSIVMRMIRHPISGDIHAFVYLRDIDISKRWEESIGGIIEKDSSSILYTRDSFVDVFKSAVSSMAPGKLCALTSFEFADLESLKSRHGHTACVTAFRMLARLCRVTILGEVAAGRVGEARVAVVRADLSSPWEQQTIIEHCKPMIENVMRKSLPEYDIRIVCGYSVTEKENANFGVMLKEAISGCAEERERLAAAKKKKQEPGGEPEEE